MKRLNPISSLFGLILTVLLFIGLGMTLWFNRGLAFSPGPVTAKSKTSVTINGFASHADFEKQCGSCHEPLKTDIATKCLTCHKAELQQIQTGDGVHSAVLQVNQCGTCHPDHRGRNFDPTLASYQLFDHSTTSFSLNWHQENYDATPMQCSECHKNQDFSLIDNQPCLDCHGANDQDFTLSHLQDYGSNCLDCHDGQDRMQNFDHSQTSFSLIGKHEEIKCAECHINGVLSDTPKECQDCHSEPVIHLGSFEQTCEACHTSESWSPAKITDQSFSHFETTGFSLVLHQTDYSTQNITCVTCHPNDLQTLDIQTCIDCHSQHDMSFMSDHQEQFGVECMVCHDGVDRLSNFEHANFFLLDGKHATLDCSACHADKLFRGTIQECWQCHQEPEIHAGVFGLSCDDCHTAEAWSPATLLKHEFPLNHGIDDQSLQFQCDTCHTTNYIDYTCSNCHEHKPDEMIKIHLAQGVNEQELPDCVKCHPTGTSAGPQD
jgi:hypothetical protein